MNKKEWEVEATIVRTAYVEADTKEQAITLAIADLHESMSETEIMPSDCIACKTGQ